MGIEPGPLDLMSDVLSTELICSILKGQKIQHYESNVNFVHDFAKEVFKINFLKGPSVKYFKNGHKAIGITCIDVRKLTFACTFPFGL